MGWCFFGLCVTLPVFLHVKCAPCVRKPKEYCSKKNVLDEIEIFGHKIQHTPKQTREKSDIRKASVKFSGGQNAHFRKA